MKPVTPNPQTTFEDLLNGLRVVEKDKQAYQLSLIIAKLQRKSRKISAKALEQFIYLTGGKDLNAFSKELNDGKVADSTKRVLECSEAFAVLDKDRTHRKRPVVIATIMMMRSYHMKEVTARQANPKTILKHSGSLLWRTLVR